ncbi:CehA/McbA family metallohydrolase [Agrobacterium tumefaciens]|uniref:CehA/McbA family metallohydrolase n=1 Tax=Agrobacterium tumefaciens TaxID=358 RepID=UPI0021D27E0C|nr:CehA/McbA family metallohydrolase [Agrobacterium tumefaciens]UXS03515.1 CehA/McbA family metallohydrolase [Agrobacterium tumefaciens]
MTEIKVQIRRADQVADPYFYVPFDVPEGVTRIDVSMVYRKAEDCVIDLGLLDPLATDYPTTAGFRGWSGGARDHFFVATDDATPGYIHGAIPAGAWKVMLGLYKVPFEGTDVTVSIQLDRAPRRLEPQPVRTMPRRKGAGWYRGDLHCHTYHSDAKGSPELLHQAAIQAGLDFLAIADHNTITQRRYFHPHSSPDLVFLRSMEVTTAVGHANVYGIDEWIDFRMTKPEHAHTLSRLVHERGGLLSINHDKPTIQWDYELPAIDCMEVWQSHWMAWNWVSIGRYQDRLASGLKITAIGGSDFHQPARLIPEGPLTLARPTTVFWLDELSEDAVIAAMKAGRGYVTESPTGPHLALTVNGQPMGSTIDGPVLAEADVKGAGGDLLVWIDATGPVSTEEIETDAWTGRFSGDAKTFLRAEIVAEKSREQLIGEFLKAQEGRSLPWQLHGADVHGQPLRRAISNPVYVIS